MAASGVWHAGVGCVPGPCIILLAGTNPCLADFNRSGTVEITDVFDFLSGWLAAEPRADMDGSGVLDVQDVFDFVNVWFAGC
jgi:hypothetical protein